MKNSILLIDKPAGWTSFDVVAKIRGRVRASYAARGIKPTKNQQKVGHAGTLDPFATGLLLILVGGETTKRSAEFLTLDKVYEATVRLGETSTTGDPEGEITPQSPKTPPTKDEVLAALRSLTGKITQRPPAYSAIKVNGQRAYHLARQGKEVIVPLRSVTIFSLECVRYDYPDLVIRARVSSGTYIRTLAEDIGSALGTGAYCQQLRRTQIGSFSVVDAKTVHEAVEDID